MCPNGVEWKTLGEVGTFFNGVTGKSKKDFDNGNAKFISYMNVFSNPKLKIDVDDTIQINEGEKQNTLQYGDVIFTTSSETPDESGMSSVLTTHTDEKIYLNSFCFGFRFNNLEIISPDFYSYIFRSERLRNQIIKCANGVTRFNISKASFAKVKIPLPPLAIQTRIVEILDHFTNLTANLTAELNLRRKQFEHYREKLLSLDGVEGVEWKKLGEVAENLDSKRKPITSSNRVSGDIPYYGASGIVDYVDGFIFDGDYLLISEDGANLLSRNTPIAFSISGKTWVNNHAHILYFEKQFCRKFVEYYINKIDLTPYISDGAQPKLNQANLNRISIPYPSEDTQHSIVSILDKFTALIVNIEKELALRQKQYEYYREELLRFGG